MIDENNRTSVSRAVWETLLLVLLFFTVAGDPPPGINEAHYLVKAKHFWDPSWLAEDVFVASRNAHTAFFATVGALTQWFDLTTTAWLGRLIGWTLLAAGLRHFCWALFRTNYAALMVAIVWIVCVKSANLAGEWVVGGIESKVLAYGFVLLGLGQMIKGRWTHVWVLLGTASAFHVLVGGWSVVVAMLVRIAASQQGVRNWPSTRNWPSVAELLCLLLGGAVSLFGLLPSLALNNDATTVDVAIAARLYAFGRIRHHLSPASFPMEWYLRHGALVLVTAIASKILYARLDVQYRDRFRPFYWFAAGAFLLAIVGGLLGLLPAINPTLAAKLLRFYWFRMTDAFIPLAAAVTTTGLVLVTSVSTSPHRLPAKWTRAIAVGVVLLCVGVLTNDFLRNINRNFPTSVRPSIRVANADGVISEKWDAETVYQDWLAVCRWARESTSIDASFITPRHQQTFKWYAHRAEVVNWKDVPQDANSLIEWAKRFNRIFPQINSRRHPPLIAAELRDIAKDYGADYIIVDRRLVQRPLPFPLVYPESRSTDSVFWVYALPPS